MKIRISLLLLLSMLACNASTVTTITPEPTAPPEPTPSAECVPPGGVPVPDDLTSDVPAQIVTYLNAGGSVPALRQAMRETGLITDEAGLLNTLLDFNADGQKDVLITYLYLDAPPAGPWPPGNLLLLLCGEGGYDLIVERADAAPEMAFIPQIVAARDLNGEPGDEILFYDGICGSHTCNNGLYGYQTDGQGGYMPLFAEPFAGPNPAFSLEQRDDDEAVEVIVDEGGIGSAGAGPQRVFQRVYNWDGSVYVQTERVQTSPSHPIHVVMDADELFNDRAYEAAFEMYERSYTDYASMDLLGGQEIWPLDELEAYARYRQVVILLVQGEEDAAQTAGEALLNDLPATEGAAFATTLLDSYNGEVAAACTAVRDALPEDWERTTSLNQFGYANTYYEPEMVCPIERQ